MSEHVSERANSLAETITPSDGIDGDTRRRRVLRVAQMIQFLAIDPEVATLRAELKSTKDRMWENGHECERLRARLAEVEAERDAAVAWNKCLSQLMYDAEGNPIDGWEDVAEAFDSDDTTWIEAWKNGTALKEPSDGDR